MKPDESAKTFLSLITDESAKTQQVYDRLVLITRDADYSIIAVMDVFTASQLVINISGPTDLQNLLTILADQILMSITEKLELQVNLCQALAELNPNSPSWQDSCLPYLRKYAIIYD